MIILVPKQMQMLLVKKVRRHPKKLSIFSKHGDHCDQSIENAFSTCAMLNDSVCEA